MTRTAIPRTPVLLLTIIAAALVAACASHPSAPTVDDSKRRPVNARASVDLQACRGELAKSTMLLDELVRTNAVSTTAVAARKPDQSCEVRDNVANHTPMTAEVMGGNQVAVVHFSYAAATWAVDDADAARLKAQASTAALIMIRGRTDAKDDSAAETALARRRAEAAAEFLVTAGTPKDKIRVTWQGAGDELSGLAVRERAKNRRVEIEFYAATPLTAVVRNEPKGMGGIAFASTLEPRIKQTVPGSATGSL